MAHTHNHTSDKPYATWWIILLGSLTAFGPLSIDMYLPALPEIAKDFDTTTDAVSQTVTAYFIGLVFGQLIYGPVSDHFGRKKPLYVGLGIYIIASAICAVASTLDNLIWVRVVQALGGCAGVVIARAAIRDRLDTVDMAKAFSALVMVMGVAPILAPSLGDLLLRIADWRTIFWVLAGIGLLNLLVVHWFFDDTLPVEKRQPLNLKNAAKGYAAVLKDKTFSLPAFGSGALMGALFVYIAASSGLLIEYFGLSSTLYSIIFGTTAAGFVATSFVNGRFTERYSLYASLKAGALVQLVFCLLLLVLASVDVANVYVVVGLIFVIVATIGVTAPNGTALALAHQAEHAGLASAMLGSIRFFMGFVGGGLFYVCQTFLSSTVVSISLSMVILVLLGVGLIYQFRPKPTA